MPNEPFDQGVNTAMDAEDLQPGEVQQAVGLFYKPGDKRRLHKQLGRSEFGDTGSGAKIKGLALLEYDSGGTDRLVVLSGTTLYSAASPAKTGTFTSLKTGLSSSATTLAAAHYSDRWYLATGHDKNFVVEPDGTIYDMGLVAPVDPLTATPDSGATASVQADGDDADFTNPANARDGDLTTYAGGTLSSAGSVDTVYNWTTANTGSTRTVTVNWQLAGSQNLSMPRDDSFDDVGGRIDAGYDVDVKLEISEDNGTSYTTFYEAKGIRYPTAQGEVQASITDALEINGNLLVRATLTYNSGTSHATLRVYDVRMNEGSPAADFSTTSGMYYAVAEYDDARDRESAPGPALLVTLSTENEVTLTFPTALNTRATHWIIYRTHDGGTSPNDLRRIGTTLITETTWVDTFVAYDKDDTTGAIVPLLTITAVEGTIRVPRMQSPPTFSAIRTFGGSLVGISKDNPRTIRYSVNGDPEAWPEIYVVSSFPMPTHDELLDCVEINDSLVFGAIGSMIRLDKLPRIVSGVFDASLPRSIKAAPGMSSRYGLTTYSVTGEQLAAWISYYGVFVTNGYSVREITSDIDWTAFEGFDKSAWVLTWDPKYQHLRMDYSSTADGTNNRYMLIHMDPMQQKANGQPKITLGHYGAANHLAQGQVGNYRRMYSGHTSDGKVYLEDDESVGNDSSNAFNASGDWPATCEMREITAGGSRFSMLTGKLLRSSFGQDITATMTMTKDDDARTQTRTETVNGTNGKGENFGIFQGGDRFTLKLEHTGTGKGGAFGEVQLRANGLGHAGKVV